MDKELKDKVIKIIEAYQKGASFTQDKYTDTPTDDLSIVPRKYITRSSTTLLRPRTSVLGEFYFDTTQNRTATWNGTNYQDPAGNVI